MKKGPRQRPRQTRLSYMEWIREGTGLFNGSNSDKWMFICPDKWMFICPDKWMFICPLCYSVFFMKDFRELGISGQFTPRVCVANNGEPCISVPEEEWIGLMPMEVYFEGEGTNRNSIKILDFYYPDMVITPNNRIWKGEVSTYEYEQEAKYNRRLWAIT
jgi:hypothetical protein